MIMHRIDRAQGLATYRVAGRPAAWEVVEAFGRIAKALGDGECRQALIVVEDTSSFLAFSDMRLLKPLAKLWRAERRHAPWALVVSDAPKQTMVQMILQLLRLRPGDFACFTSEDSARQWLGSAPR